MKTKIKANNLYLFIAFVYYLSEIMNFRLIFA